MAFSFPKDFLWGAACSAYQIEGAWNEGGKGLSCHDYYARLPEYEKFYELGRPDDCADFYHHYREDIDIMAERNLKSFRFSIAWPRLFPNGPDEINQECVDYYNDMFSYLNEKGIIPFVDLFHWDLPQWVLDRGGAASREFIDLFEGFARACYANFGDKVKYWSTTNEPSVSIFCGYADWNLNGGGMFPPYEDDRTKAFTACHNMNLAHMRAVKAYREMGQDGKIGAVIDAFPFYPYNFNDKRDMEAGEQMWDFYAGKWLGPILLGKYPDVIVEHFSQYMPEGYQEEIAAAYEPVDYIGNNYYAPRYAKYSPEAPYYSPAPDPELVPVKEGGEFVGMKYYPEGLFDTIRMLDKKYHPKEIIITENGMSAARDPKNPAVPSKINDENRIRYMRSHIMMLSRILEQGINVTGYYVWAIEDTYEHGSGCRYDYGLIGINYDTKERTPRDSFNWYGEFIKANT
ncbi:MAG: glycosyl hydrolase family protein [Ruminococcaceae bacterium]|nr:glycosyl hydrolase family protein [Oscillospiraceae bacterium]